MEAKFKILATEFKRKSYKFVFKKLHWVYGNHSLFPTGDSKQATLAKFIRASENCVAFSNGYLIYFIYLFILQFFNSYLAAEFFTGITSK